ncbi:hypothetical protein MtrunA17_Chr5g0418051 [Medicago truncatula]|uniref:Uncharacterized protein n=1 Tax=Medicago truncatula TaxID=3880 RepID=A0A396HU39_MEDTR|nr:hypothetical protein MtrunA17_Chr5g0418051 [Medicago truncatula]
MGSVDLWLCWFVVLHGVFHGVADFGSFVTGLVVDFGGQCSFDDGGGGGVDFCGVVWVVCEQWNVGGESCYCGSCDDA